MYHRRIRLDIVVLLALAICALLPAGTREAFCAPEINPTLVAQAETGMWQAYYTRDMQLLGARLIVFIQGQYGASMLDSVKIGQLLASSAMKFKEARGDYETVALPDLIEAYSQIKVVSGASFDPEPCARAELAWWVARRTTGENSAEQVGGKITELYALLYGGRNPQIERAGLLRAQAAKLRDDGGVNADWTKVEELLRQSYSALAEGVKALAANAKAPEAPVAQDNQARQANP